MHFSFIGWRRTRRLWLPGEMPQVWVMHSQQGRPQIQTHVALLMFGSKNLWYPRTSVQNLWRGFMMWSCARFSRIHFTLLVLNVLLCPTTSEISGPIILDTYRAISDFAKTSKHEIDLHVDDHVEIVEKNPNGEGRPGIFELHLVGDQKQLVLSRFLLSSSGWWFCQCESRRGWVPASYLEPLDGPEEAEDGDPNYEGKAFFFRPSSLCGCPVVLCASLTEQCIPAGELHVTIKAYKAEQQDEISLELGETIEVIHKLLDGWWVVRYKRFNLSDSERNNYWGANCRQNLLAPSS